MHQRISKCNNLQLHDYSTKSIESAPFISFFMSHHLAHEIAIMAVPKYDYPTSRILCGKFTDPRRVSISAMIGTICTFHAMCFPNPFNRPTSYRCWKEVIKYHRSYFSWSDQLYNSSAVKESLLNYRLENMHKLTA